MKILPNGTISGEIKRGTELGRAYSRNLYQWLPCTKCGKYRWVTLRFKVPVSQTCPKCRQHNPRPSVWGDKHFRWKGGRRTPKSGYIEVRIYPTDPFRAIAKKSGYVLEHRLIMCRHLGRLLKEGEQVHHINGIRDDNRIENLEVRDIREHRLLHAELEREVKTLRWRVKELEEQVRKLKEGRCVV